MIKNKKTRKTFTEKRGITAGKGTLEKEDPVNLGERERKTTGLRKEGVNKDKSLKKVGPYWGRVAKEV